MLKESHWRTTSKKIIREIIGRIGISDTEKLKLELRNAYPFGERKYYPYKIWMNECHKALGHIRRNSHQRNLKNVM